MLDLVSGQSNDGRHGANTDRDCFLHESPALTNEMHGIPETKGSGTHQGREFAQAVTRRQHGINTMIAEPFQGNYTVDQKRRLCIFSEFQLFFRPLKAHLADVVPQDFIGFLKHPAAF
ncbi:hypothetical protein J2S31_001462 [Nitrospina gracilis Nb-211]|nr:hypothetical protein [Nitrospina gracilis Nb-211]